ncbi:hypothetical protein J6590_024065 [Homalodisca vitripennis]|nr:hypothetical protein J6590_024065 [Homalodisca vitripennis]
MFLTCGLRLGFCLHLERDIVQRIKDKVYECHRSIFVFDEVEKMPNGLLEVLSGVVTIGVHREYDFR